MGALKLKPACKEYIWGGDRLINEYGIEADGEICAEAWVLSGHKDGISTVADGIYKGQTLAEVNAKHKILGKNCDKYKEFPILIKLIDAKKSLSIQVHPDDEYSLEHEGQYGKTEMWYIIAAEYVKAGDVVFIEPGTLHAIGSGIMIAEIQQSSNITYRIYDYGRLGADGKPRELHVEKALDVLKREPAKKYVQKGEHLVECSYFCVDKADVKEGVSYEGNVDDSSFASLLVIDGECTISVAGEAISAKKGESYLIAAGTGAYTISGNASVLITKVP